MTSHSLSYSSRATLLQLETNVGEQCCMTDLMHQPKKGKLNQKAKLRDRSRALADLSLNQRHREQTSARRVIMHMSSHYAEAKFLANVWLDLSPCTSQALSQTETSHENYWHNIKTCVRVLWGNYKRMALVTHQLMMQLQHVELAHLMTRLRFSLLLHAE